MNEGWECILSSTAFLQLALGSSYACLPLYLFQNYNFKTYPILYLVSLPSSMSSPACCWYPWSRVAWAKPPCLHWESRVAHSE